MGIEFPGDVPFRDVYVHSVIQARDGRRMSKSLGTGVDPLEEIDRHGADALRFGLLAMSSTQDVRFSDAKVQQGADLTNKLWNASRLILMNCKFDQDQSHINSAQDQVPARVGAGTTKPTPCTPEDRWILSRLERTIASVTGRLEAYDFAHAAQEAYAFFWSELCDWYLEMVKPRLYEGDEAASANLLWALERVLALLHPMMPFVTEEIWSYHPARRGHLAVHEFPEADDSLVDAEAEAAVGAGIELTRRLRAWRDLVEAPAATVLPARAEGVEPQEFVGRLARFAFDDDGGEPVAAVGPVRVLASDAIDADAVRARIEARREELRSEVARAEGKLGNERFVANAPPEVVAEEREKLERYGAELEELSE
jgi:valyl-tRNA synthetase